MAFQTSRDVYGALLAAGLAGLILLILRGRTSDRDDDRRVRE